MAYPREDQDTRPEWLKQAERLEKQLVESGALPPQMEAPSPVSERFGKLVDYFSNKETRPKNVFGLIDAGSKVAEAVTEVGRVKGEPVYFDPSMMTAMGSVKKASEAIEKLGKKDALGFTSKAETVVKEKMGGRASADEIKAMLQSAGVKTEELEDRGFFKWLDEKREELLAEGKTPQVTKEAVAEELTGERRPTLSTSELGGPKNEARVKHQEKLNQEILELEDKKLSLGSQLKTRAQKMLQPQIESQRKEIIDELTPLFLKQDQFIERPELWIQSAFEQASTNNMQQLGKAADHIARYTGKSFSEVLELIDKWNAPKVDGNYVGLGALPVLLEKAAAPDEQTSIMAKAIIEKLSGLSAAEIDGFVDDYYRLDDQIRLNRNEINRLVGIGQLTSPKYKQYSLSSKYGIGENYREKLFSEPRSAGENYFGKWPTHFANKKGGEKPLFWIRMQDVTDTEGRKLLNMDELQSDVHQQGREKGYLKRDLTTDEVKQAWKIVKTSDEFDAIPELKNIALERNGVNSLKNALSYMDDKTYAKLKPMFQDTGPIADAPMKKNWVRAGVKNLIQTAIEEGKDGISWTPGKMQAKRFGQGMEEVGRLEYTDEQKLIVYDRKGYPLTKETIPQQELSSYVGPEIAKELKAQRQKNIRTKAALQKNADTIREEILKELRKKNSWINSDTEQRARDAIEAGFDRTLAVEVNELYYKQLLRLGADDLTLREYEDAIFNLDHHRAHKKNAFVSGDLKFGGHGMETFYDTMVKNEVESIAKKYGLKVQKTKVRAKNGEEIELWHLPFNDKIRKDITEKGQTLYQAIPAAVGLGELMRQYKQEQEQERVQ